LPQGIALDDAGLLAGSALESGTFLFTVRVTDSDGNVTDKILSLDVLLVDPPSLIRIHKTSTATVPGRTLTYYIIIENMSTNDLHDAIGFEFFLPPSYFTFVSAEPVPAVVQHPFIFWNIPLIKAGGISILKYRAILNPAVAIGDTVVGPASVDFVKDKLKQRFRKTLDDWGKRPCVNPVPLAEAKIFCEKAIDTCFPVGFLGCLLNANECAKQLEDAVEGCKKPQGQDPPPMCLLPQPEYAFTCRDASQPVDPNEKLVSPEGFVRPEETILYPIHFENIGSVEAQDVFIRDALDPNLDETTIQILSPGASFDPTTRKLSRILIGRNLQPGESDSVLFLVKGRPGLASGTEIRNKATIQFEIFQPFDTNEVVTVIDTTRPTCTVNSLPPETHTETFTVSWTTTDAIGKVDTVSVLVSKDGGPFEPFLNTNDPSAEFVGQFGHSYGFLCVATDTATNVEIKEPLVEALTTLVRVPPPGRILSDLKDAKAWVGLRNSDDVGLRLDLQAEAFIDSELPDKLIGQGHLDNVVAGSSGFNNAQLRTIPLDLTNGPVVLPVGSKLLLRLSARRTCSGAGHASGTPRLWYNGKAIDSGPARDAGTRFVATIDEEDVTFYLRSGLSLDEFAGASRLLIDKALNSKEPCPQRQFIPFGTWSWTVPAAE
jgi:uncharacterized repeat protein (TIGR01451 family)